MYIKIEKNKKDTN